MTLQEFEKTLVELDAGNFAAIHHDLFAELFPPGEPDEAARAACYRFAQSYGMQD